MGLPKEVVNNDDEHGFEMIEKKEGAAETSLLAGISKELLGARLDYAIAKGSIEEVSSAARAGTSEEQNSRGLVLAAMHGRADCVELLIPLSDIESVGGQAVQIAAKGNRVDVLKALLGAGANAKSHKSYALALAAGKGHFKCVELLIPRSNPAAENSRALLWAVEGGCMDCVRALLPLSDPLALSDGEMSPRAAAMAKEKWSIVELFDAHCERIELERSVAAGARQASGLRL